MKKRRPPLAVVKRAWETSAPVEAMQGVDKEEVVLKKGELL